MIKTFQEIVADLDNFWSKQGCYLTFPYGIEVGAATANPNSFLQTILADEWKVAYVEPCRRPADARFGDSSNRLQHYFQYQTILKPIPDNNIAMFYKSLDVIGFETEKHDIRFVEDNWEQPSIGASGLGWEVWFDGMEIAQYTYFQKLGGINLPEPALEITYGLERITMHIQDVDHYRDILWDQNLVYGEMYEQREKEFSQYNYKKATVKSLRNLFDTYEKEAKKCVENELPFVAYDYVLKMSHVFNILDARGVVGPSQRHKTFSKMRSVVGDLLEQLTQEFVE
jgi:glycyl-tRNA synthetase alpha chain